MEVMGSFFLFALTSARMRSAPAAGVVDGQEQRPKVDSGAEGEVGVEDDDGDVIALVRPRGAVEKEAEPVRCSGHQPSVAGTPVGFDRVSHDDGRSAINGVEDAADGVVQRGLGVETTTCRVGEPADEAVEETAKAVDRVPFPRWVEVEAQPTSLEYVRVMRNRR
jgi:hypothetical protein